MKFQKNKIIKIADPFALFIAETPDTQKLLYNFVELDKDSDEGKYIILASDENLETLLFNAIQVLAFSIKKLMCIEECFSKIEQILTKGDPVEYKFHQKIQKDFCIKEMKIPKEAYEYDGAYSWNVLFKKGNKYEYGTE